MNCRSLDKFDTFQSYGWVKKGSRKLSIGDTCSVWVDGREATLTVAALGLMSEGQDRVLPMVAYTVSYADAIGEETMHIVSFNKLWHDIKNFTPVSRSFVNCFFPNTLRSSTPPSAQKRWPRQVRGRAGIHADALEGQQVRPVLGYPAIYGSASVTASP